MKRLAFGIVTVLLFFLTALGCTVTSTDTASTGTTSSGSATTTTMSSETTTTDPEIALLEAEFIRISQMIPAEITADFWLPEPENPAISIDYALDGFFLVEKRLVYDYPESDQISQLSVTIRVGEKTIFRTISVVFAYDEDLYNQHQSDLRFELVRTRLAEQIPEEIRGDFPVPVISDSAVRLQFEPSRSYIYRQRFIFDFPVSDLVMTFGVFVTIGTETRRYDFPILMKGQASLPRIAELFIETENHAPIVSKEDYINATLTMLTYDGSNQPLTVLPAQPIEIRGRGNSTFYMPKMPYRIKFPSKTALTGEYKEKTWVLLANYTDQTLLRNYLAYNLARDLGMGFAPTAMFVDLYLNGDYVGNYLVTDQIEVTSNRVNVERNSVEADTGYLLELDQRLWETPEGIENWDYFNVEGYLFAIKYPKTDEEYFNQAQFDYIVNAMNTLFQTLRNKQDYSALIDERSFVDWFIVNEWFKNVDSGYSSVYLHKDKGGPFVMGPVWDFDLSSGNQQPQLSAQLRGPEGWYTARPDKNPLYYYLMQYPSFRTALKNRWNELYPQILPNLIDRIDPTAEAIAYSRAMNFQRWDVIGKNNEWYTNPEILALDTYEEQVAFLHDYLQTRMQWLNAAINGL
jgi:hypothetical protein